MNSLSDVRLETKRTVLREIEPADAALLQALSADPDITRFVEWPLKTLAEHEGFVRESIAARARTPRAAYRLAITGREDGGVRGFIRMTVFAPEERADLGYYLFRPWWGSGLATEAGKAVLDLAFGRLGVTRIETHCDVRNAASARVLEKLGMRRVRTGSWETAAGTRTAHFYALTRPA